MDEKKRKQILNDMNTEDFNTMREMLSEIEMKIMQVDPIIQHQFYQTIKLVIFEAWCDACNPDDIFLFKREKDEPL
jgi:hypothetical protein